MAGLDRTHNNSSNPIITNEGDAQGNFDRLTVLQDVAQSDLSAKAYFAEELVPSDGNSAIVTAIDEILGIRRYGGMPDGDVANMGGANALYAALARKAVQSQEAATTHAASSDILARHPDKDITAPLFEDPREPRTPFRPTPEGGPTPAPTPSPTPGPTPSPTPGPTEPHSAHPIVDLDLGINTRDPSISLGLIIDPTGTTLLDLDATVETIANTSANLTATIDTLIKGTTLVTANVASDLVNGLHGTVGNVINLVTGTGGTKPIISLNTANNLLADPSGILSKTTLGIDLTGDKLLDVNATVNTVADTTASLQAKVDTLLSGGDIIPNATTELSTLLTSLPTLQPGSSDGPILSIDSATDLLSDPTKIFTDLTLGIDPNGSTLLDVGATLDTVADTATGVQGVVENLTSGADITTDLTSALTETLGGLTEAGFPDIKPGSDDAPIISLQSANNLLENPTAEITNTLLVINPNGNTLLGGNATLDTIADTSADAQAVLENLTDGGNVLANATSQLDDMIGFSTQSPPDVGALVEAVNVGLTNGQLITDSILDVGIGEDPVAVVTEGVTHLLETALDPQPASGNETPVVSAESINNVLSNPTDAITDTVITVIPSGDTLLDANAVLGSVANTTAGQQAVVDSLTNSPDIVPTLTSGLQDLPDNLPTGDTWLNLQGVEETLANVTNGLTQLPQGDPASLIPADPAATVQELVETITGSDDIVSTVTNELTELLNTQTGQGSSASDAPIITIDTASDILSNPANLFSDTDINIDPTGNTLLDVNAALDTVADTAADAQAVVENLVTNPDIMATVTTGVNELLSTPADPSDNLLGDPVANAQLLVQNITGSADPITTVTEELNTLVTGSGSGNDAPIIGVETLSNVLGNSTAAITDTVVDIDPAGGTLLDAHMVVDTVADLTANVQTVVENLTTLPVITAALNDTPVLSSLSAIENLYSAPSVLPESTVTASEPLSVQEMASPAPILSTLSVIENLTGSPATSAALPEPIAAVTETVVPTVSTVVTSSLSSLESLTAPVTGGTADTATTTLADTTHVTSPDPAIMTTLMDNTLHETTTVAASSGAASYDINHVLDAVVATATSTTSSSSSSGSTGSTSSGSSGTSGSSSWTEQVTQAPTTAQQTTTSVLNATVPAVDTTVHTTTTNVFTKLKKLF